MIKKEHNTNEIGQIVEYEPKFGSTLISDSLNELRDTLHYGLSPRQSSSKEIPFEEEMQKEREMFFNNKKYK